MNIELSRGLKEKLLRLYTKLDAAVWEIVNKNNPGAEDRIRDVMDEVKSLIIDKQTVV